MPEPIAVTPEVEAQPIPEASSLAEHRESLTVPPADDAPPKPERHRARSQTANPDDVRQIAENTKRLRQEEDALIADAGLTIERKHGESERAFNIRKRAEITEAARASFKAKPAAIAPVPEVSLPPVPRSQTPTPEGFTEKEPTIEQFRDQPDPYVAHIRALNAFDRRKETFDAQQKTAQTEAATARDKWVEQVQTDHRARFQEFVSANPTEKTLLDSEFAKPPGNQLILTPIMRVAIETSRQGPQFMVELLRHPELADELILQTDGRYAFDSDGRLVAAVATLQRRLAARVQTVSTGAVAPKSPVVAAPRPPTPVRTVPVAPPERRNLESESGSLAEHRAKFGKR